MGSPVYFHSIFIFYMASKTLRVTIVLEDDLIKKLRQKQAKLIQQTNKTVSFSGIIAVELRKALK